MRRVLQLRQRLPLSKQMADAPPKRMQPETDVWVLHIVCDCNVDCVCVSVCVRVCVQLSFENCLLGVKFMHFGWLTTTDNYNNNVLHEYVKWQRGNI